MASTVVLSHPACFEHHVRHHPEQPNRVLCIENAVRSACGSLVAYDTAAPRATEEALLRFHTAKHVRHVLDLCVACERSASAPVDPRRKRGKGSTRSIDDDTKVMGRTREAALRAAGAAIRAVDIVCDPRECARNAFCCVRPPGHHATPSKAMGFCYFNNVAVAVCHARAAHGLRRVAVVDVDVHHGNGTEAGFATDHDVLYCSFHQHGAGFYPETGGSAAQAANVVNCPLERGAGSAEVKRAFADRIIPALQTFEPQLVLISLGLDALAADPLGGMRLEPEDYAWMTRDLCDVANSCCEGRVVSVLEGGYDLKAISFAAVEHVKALVLAQRSTAQDRAPHTEPPPEPHSDSRAEPAAAHAAAQKERADTTATATAAAKKSDNSGLVWEDHGIDSDDAHDDEAPRFAQASPDDDWSGTSWGSRAYSTEDDADDDRQDTEAAVVQKQQDDDDDDDDDDDNDDVVPSPTILATTIVLDELATALGELAAAPDL